MAHAQDEANENHWPGYVDALTTMLMVLTFVMMILGIAVFAMSQNVSRIIVETIAKAALIEPPTDNVPVPELTERILEKLRLHPPRPPLRTIEEAPVEAGRASEPTPRAASADADPNAETAKLGQETRLTSLQEAFVPAAAVPVRSAVSGQALVLEFRQRATRLDEATARRLAETLVTEARFKDAEVVEVRALVDRSAASLTDARRVAYYRAMLVRGALLRAGVPAARIRVHNDESAAGTGDQASRDLVRVVPQSKAP